MCRHSGASGAGSGGSGGPGGAAQAGAAGMPSGAVTRRRGERAWRHAAASSRSRLRPSRSPITSAVAASATGAASDRERRQRQDVAGGHPPRPDDHGRHRGDGHLPGGQPGQDLVGHLDVGGDGHGVADLIAHGPFPFFPFAERRALAAAGRGRRAAAGATRDSTAAVTANRTARRSGERPNGDSTGRATQNGIRISTHSRHKRDQDLLQVAGGARAASRGRRTLPRRR